MITTLYNVFFGSAEHKHLVRFTPKANSNLSHSFDHYRGESELKKLEFKGLKFNWIISDSDHYASDELHVGNLQTNFWLKFFCCYSQDLAAKINLWTKLIKVHFSSLSCPS